MKTRIAALAVMMTFALSVFAASPAIPRKKQEAIKTLLKVTGMVKLANQMIGQMVDSYAKTMPSVQPEVWHRMKKQMSADELVGLMIPIYDKYYTQEDVDGMITFYRTPLGQKVISTLPEVSREGFQVGQEWGKKKSDEIVKQLRKEGYIQQ